MAIRNKDAENNPRGYGDAGSASEVSAFKKGLIDISLETIRDRLDSKTITRKWKRDLVEAELARREDDDDAAAAPDAGLTKKKGRTGQWAAAGIIGICSLIILYTMLQVWLM